MNIYRIRFSHILFTVFISIVLFFITSILINPKHNEYFMESDFPTYYMTSVLIKEGGVKNLFNDAFQREYFSSMYHGKYPSLPILVYINLPLPALIFFPYTYLSPELAYKINAVVSIFLLFFILFFLVDQAKLDRGIFFLLVIFLPVYGGIYYGQLSIIILGLLLLILLSTKKNNTTLLGLFSSLLFIKMQYLLFIPYLLLLVKEKRKYLLTTLAFSLIYLLINMLVYGSNVFQDYIQYMQFHKSINFGNGFYYNLFSMYKIVDARMIGFLTFLLILLSMICVWYYRNTRSLLTLFSSIILFGLTLNVHTMYTDLLFLVIPLIAFYKRTQLSVKSLFILGLFVASYSYSWQGYILATFILLILGFSNLFIKE